MLDTSNSGRQISGKTRTDSIRYVLGSCSLGAVLVACSDKGVCAILLGDEPVGLIQELQGRFPAANLVAARDELADHVAKVVALIEAPSTHLDLPLDLRGTPFQQRVWQVLRDTPAGETITYTEIARRIGQPKARRGVGQACGANPLAVVIPCHRVLRTDGSLSGYRWGVERKRALLEKESQA